MVFVADDLAAWLIGLLADRGRRRLTTVLLSSEQEGALRSAAAAAVKQTARELRPDEAEQAEHLALLISQVFGQPVPGVPLDAHQTILEALQAGIAAQLAVLDDASLTGTGRSSSEALAVPGLVVAERLTGHLLREIVVRGSQGGPLFPLASQLNHDMARLDSEQLKGMVGEALEALARLEGVRPEVAAPTTLGGPPSSATGFTNREADMAAGQAFISYVREDSHQVDQLQRTLQAAGIPVWRDTADLWPGEDWRAKIRHAITKNALVFIACFSRASLARGKSYQNEELALAIGQMRLRRPDDPWLIPVRFDECEIPDWDIGGGRTLMSIQHADLFGDRSDEGAARLVATVLRILRRQSAPAAATTAAQSQPATSMTGPSEPPAKPSSLASRSAGTSGNHDSAVRTLDSRTEGHGQNDGGSAGQTIKTLRKLLTNPNPWMITVVGGLIVTIVGGLAVAALSPGSKPFRSKPEPVNLYDRLILINHPIAFYTFDVREQRDLPGRIG